MIAAELLRVGLIAKSEVRGAVMDFSKLAEQQILKAQAEGQFDKLKKRKESNEPSDGSVEAVGFRIMAEAGVLPREIQLLKEIELQRAKLRAAQTEAEKRAESQKLAELQLRLDIEQEARRRYSSS